VTAFYAKGRESSYLHAESQGELVLHRHGDELPSHRRGDLDPSVQYSAEATKVQSVSLINGR
jgi:hypothetical protein